METKHTPEPWSQDGRFIVGADSMHVNGRRRNSAGISSASYSNRVCEIYGNSEVRFDDLDPTAPRENARRIVACVNACSGVPTEKLESDYYQGADPWSHVKSLENRLNLANEQRAELLESLVELEENLRNAADWAPSHITKDILKMMCDEAQKIIAKATKE